MKLTKCRICGREFEKSMTRKKYCSRECRQEAQKKQIALNNKRRDNKKRQMKDMRKCIYQDDSRTCSKTLKRRDRRYTICKYAKDCPFYTQNFDEEYNDMRNNNVKNVNECISDVTIFCK